MPADHGSVMTVGGVVFQLANTIEELIGLADDDGFVVGKTPRGIAKYRQHIDPGRIDNVFELGIFRGGSTIFFDRLLRPKRMAAIEIDGPVAMLEEWIDRERARDRISTFYGTDQADAAALRNIYASVFGEEPLDLVLDDASHLLEETRASFNTLFPKLREGGLYVIEDWAITECFRGYEALLTPELRDSAPMSILINEIVMSSARASNVVDEVLISDGFVLVRRGGETLDDSFDIRRFA